MEFNIIEYEKSPEEYITKNAMLHRKQLLKEFGDEVVSDSINELTITETVSLIERIVEDVKTYPTTLGGAFMYGELSIMATWEKRGISLTIEVIMGYAENVACDYDINDEIKHKMVRSGGYMPSERDELEEIVDRWIDAINDFGTLRYPKPIWDSLHTKWRKVIYFIKQIFKRKVRENRK